MAKALEDWKPIAEQLGFSEEREMLDNLYNEQQFSIKELSTVIGFCTASIRYRLLAHGIDLRARGGSKNKIGKRRLKHVPTEELLTSKTMTIAEKYQVHPSTVYAEKQLRKREGRRHEVLPNNADISVQPLREEQRSLDGASSVDACEGVQGVLPEEEGAGGGGDIG